MGFGFLSRIRYDNILRFVAIIAVVCIVFLFRNGFASLVPGTQKYYGVLDTDMFRLSCAKGEICGPRSQLYDKGLGNPVPLVGLFGPWDSGRVVEAVGIQRSKDVFVLSYTRLGSFGFKKFLDGKAGEYTRANYPCLVDTFQSDYGGDYIATKWGKSYSFDVSGLNAVYKVRLSDPASGAPQYQMKNVNGTMVKTMVKPVGERYYELWYDGDSGALLKDLKVPSDLSVCGA